MISKTIVLLVMCALFISPVWGNSKTLTEEQMTAYRTRPAVVLIYSGMSITVNTKNGSSKLPYYGSGTGFFINPGGYLVTNGHVVDIFHKYMKDKNAFAQQVMMNMIRNQVVQQFKSSYGREPTGPELERAVNNYIRQQQPTLAGHDGINYVLLSNSENHRFEIKKFSPSIPEGGKDIAILKIERENCPVIMLGDSQNLVLQQTVFTIGFPAVVDPQRFPILDRKNTLRSSITRGSISALKTDFKGMSVIQHDSATSPGNSGGPTVDSQGRVIGVHSYAALKYDGFKFSVPINAAKEFIRDAGVEFNVTSEFTDVFNQLMDAVWQEKWTEAQTLVTTALAYMEGEPDLKKIQRMVLKKISDIQKERDSMGFFERLWKENKLIVIIALVLIVLILVILKMALFPGKTEEKASEFSIGAVKDAPPKPTVAPAEEDKTTLELSDGTVLESEIYGTMTVILNNDEIGTYNISNTPLILGRDPKSASIPVVYEIVSKNHLKITVKGDQFYIVDLGSTNGTFVNGEKVNETLVRPEDDVRLGKKGDVRLIFKK